MAVDFENASLIRAEAMNSVPQNLWDRIPQMSPGDLAILSLSVIAAVLVAIAIIGSIIYAMHKNRLEDSLKRELLDRGMSADEIATVIGAKPDKSESQRRQRA